MKANTNEGIGGVTVPKITHDFYNPATGEVVNELTPEQHKAFIHELIKDPIRWHIENIKSGKYKPEEKEKPAS